jgi:hypothetical protein
MAEKRTIPPEQILTAVIHDFCAMSDPISMALIRNPKDGVCFDRGQGTQLCEATEDACNKLRDLNKEIAKSPCKRVERPET